MSKFKLMSGVHSIGKGTDGVDRFAYAGGVFESSQDLQSHNVPGSPKRFELVDKATPVTVSLVDPPTAGPPEPTAPVDPAMMQEVLESKTVKELRQIADDEEIDLEGFTAKADLVKHLLSQMVSA